MKSFIFSILASITIISGSCSKCKMCTYYEVLNDSIVYQSPLDGEYCGDEYRTLEKKEYVVAQGEAYVKCVD